MSYTLVQSQPANSGTSSGVSSLAVTTSATGSGNLLIAGVTCQNGTGAATITAPSGWSQVGSTVTISNTTVALFYLPNSTSGVTSFTFNASVSSRMSIIFEEWQGPATSSPLDKSASNSSATTTTSVTTSATAALAASGELAIWFCGTNGATVETYSSITNSYVEDQATATTNTSGNKSQGAMFYNTSVGSAATSSGCTLGTASAYGAILAVFKIGVTTSTRTIPTSAALQTTSTRTIPTSAALQTTNTRTIPTTAALAKLRTIPTSAALQTTSTRTIPTSAALLVTSSRTIPTSASLSVPANYTPYRALLNLRISYMAPPIIRTAVPAVSWWCPTGVVGTYDFTNLDMQELYAVLDEAQTIDATVIVVVNSPSPFTATSTGFATAFSDLINYLINTLGYTTISYVSGLSEPDTNGLAYTDYKNTLVPNLVSALATNNLQNAVSILGPDTAMAEDSWLTSASSDLKSSLGGYVRHAFPSGATDISNDSRETTVASLITGIYTNDNTNKPIIQGEMGYGYLGPGAAVAQFQYGVEMADYAVQLMRAGIAAPIAYFLDDDEHGTEWGFWQITEDTGVPRPWFFPWSLLCRNLLAGSTIYAPAQPTTNDFRYLAAQSPQGGWTFVLVNRRAVSQNVQISVPFVPVASTTLQQYVYSAQTPLLVDSNGFPLVAGTLQAILARGFTVSLASNSVLILTQQTAIVTNVFDVKRGPLQKRR